MSAGKSVRLRYLRQQENVVTYKCGSLALVLSCYSNKMESSFLYFVAVALLTAAARGQTGRTVHDYYKEEFGEELLAYYTPNWPRFRDYFAMVSSHVTFFWKLTREAIQYSDAIDSRTVTEFASYVDNVTLQSVAQNFSDTCGEYPGNWREIRNEPCVARWMRDWLEGSLELAVAAAARSYSLQCRLQICSKTRANCTSAYEERLVKLVIKYVPYVIKPMFNETSHFTQFLVSNIKYSLNLVLNPHQILFRYYQILDFVMSTAPTLEPFRDDNIFRARIVKFFTILYAIRKYDPLIKTQERVTWGIIRSTQGSVDNQCSAYKEEGRARGWDAHYGLITLCYQFDALQLHVDLVDCVYQDQVSAPLTWSTFRSAFFHSQCLCLAYDGTECGVRAPEGVEPFAYCLSVLLRDFQRQISFRPAVTYLDYSYMTRVPVCQFSYLIQEKFYDMCDKAIRLKNFNFVASAQCSFYGLLNQNLNCSEITKINTYDATFLCQNYLFINYVNCEGDVGESISFYSPGDSSLVRALTYVDVSVRLLTLVTYLSCPELRNLPGKVLIGYQATALLRLLVVRASLEDLALAVRLDVALDLSSTLWLTSYLHFLTSSIKTLRLPDSLNRQEVRNVLLRYFFLGWALPAALSAAFFSMDEAIESPVQFGQLLFVLCNYAALLWNLYMFYHNCLFYYDVKKNALSLKPGAKASAVFTGLFNFALKTSVLSGMGITVRLVFTQIQGLEELLGYYHALGTLQGLLVFLLYGCNREARDFWHRILCVTLPRCFRRQNTVV